MERPLTLLRVLNKLSHRVHQWNQPITQSNILCLVKRVSVILLFLKDLSSFGFACFFAFFQMAVSRSLL